MTTAAARTDRPAATAGRAALLVLAAIVVAAVANAIVAAVASALSPQPSMMALTPPVFVVFTIAGVLVAYAGWRIVRRLAPRPGAVLRVLVPVVLLVSWTPDVLVGITEALPGTSWTGVIGLMIMHVVTVGVVVPVFQRIAPVR